MSIKTRLLVAISVLIAIAFLTIGVVTVAVTRDRMIERIDETLTTAIAKRPRSIAEDGNPGPRGDSKRATATIILDEEGNVYHSEPSGFVDDPDPFPALQVSDLTDNLGQIFTTGAADGSDLRFRVVVRPLNGGLFAVAAAPLDDVAATTRNLVMVIGVAGLTVLAAVVLIVWLTIRRGLQPIDDMITTAGLIASGDLGQRVKHEDTGTEVGQLGQALNTMLTRIEASFAAKDASERRLRQFVADASHELRTPLTSIRGYAELYRTGAASSPDGLKQVMKRIESEGTRMGRLVEDLLLLARLDQGRELEREPVDLVPLVEDTVMDARVIQPDRPISYDHPDEAWVLGDADRLRQVIGNLLTNARVHTDPKTPVHVGIAVNEDSVMLSVADDGPGISPEHADRVFDRFYRIDPSRARSNGGTGLGLSIVASIVEAHSGQVSVESEPDQGTTFTITLPRNGAVHSRPAMLLDPAAAMA